jgi:4-diphosphocytidyl-2-C-methyl-D-erythritol kinase
LVFPDIHISTAEAYRNIKLSEPKDSISDILQKPLNEWKNHLFNDFENSVFPKYHALENIKEQLYASGALYASMSGSGSTIYGIFDHSPVLQNKFPHSFLSKL